MTIRKPNKFLLASVLAGTFFFSQAQHTAINHPAFKHYREGIELYQNHLYENARSAFSNLLTELQRNPSQLAQNQTLLTDARYYHTLCLLNLDDTHAAGLAEEFIQQSAQPVQAQIVSFHLARYYYRHHNFGQAIYYYEKAGIDNLTNQEIAEGKFELAYCYFNNKDFEKAKNQFASIKEIPGKYFKPGNYYYGLLSYYYKDYNAALSSFQRIDKEEEYKQLVPYYIAEIYYFTGQKEKTLSIAEPYLNRKEKIYYETELHQLVGQCYFEDGAYEKALPFLEYYAGHASTLRLQDQYQLAYTYYQTGNLPKAIEGFRELSSEKDSLGQNAMYLLADCYLKTGDKRSARNAFSICAESDRNPGMQEVASFNYAKLSYDLGYNDVANQSLQQFVRQYPQSTFQPEAKGLLAETFLRSNNYTAAFDILSELDQSDSKLNRVYQKVTYGRAIQLMQDGNYAMADSLLSLSLQRATEKEQEALAHYWKGEMSFKRKDYTDAASHLTHYFDIQKYYPVKDDAVHPQSAAYLLGYSYFQQEKYSEAYPWFVQAEKAPNDKPESKLIVADATLRGADCLFMNRQYSEARKKYAVAAELNKGNAAYAKYQKAVIQGLEGNTQSKVAELKTLADDKTESSPEAAYELALTYMESKQYAEALKYLKPLIDRNDAAFAPKALLSAAVASDNSDQNAQAKTYYQQLLTQYPQSAEAGNAMAALRNLYIEEGSPEGFYTYLKSQNISDTTAASNEEQDYFEVAEDAYNTGNCLKAVVALNKYIEKYPQGQNIALVYYYKGDCQLKLKNNKEALAAWETLLAMPANEFQVKAAGTAAELWFADKSYGKAKEAFEFLNTNTTKPALKQQARQGMMKTAFETDNTATGIELANAILADATAGTNDKLLADFYLGKNDYRNKAYAEAGTHLDRVVAQSKSAIGAEALYLTAAIQFEQKQLEAAETTAFKVIKDYPSYDLWVASSYLLLGDIFTAQKDYFNAKATFKSLSEKCPVEKIKLQAKTRLEEVSKLEKTR